MLEKIKDPNEKLNRLIELAGIKENVNYTKPTLSTSGRLMNILHEAVASDGVSYAIVQENKNIYIKKKINGVYEYITGIQNISEYQYKTYSNALKNLNFIFKQINESVGYTDNVDTLRGGLIEEKKFVLKKKSNTEQPIEPKNKPPLDKGGFDVDNSKPSDVNNDDFDDDMDINDDLPLPDSDMQPNDEPNDFDQDTENIDNNQDSDGGDLKSIQKLTGKLSQQIRSNVEVLSASDLKATINSVLSAVDFTKFDNEDKSDIINKIEGDDDTDENIQEVDSMIEDDNNHIPSYRRKVDTSKPRASRKCRTILNTYFDDYGRIRKNIFPNFNIISNNDLEIRIMNQKSDEFYVYLKIGTTDYYNDAIVENLNKFMAYLDNNDLNNVSEYKSDFYIDFKNNQKSFEEISKFSDVVKINQLDRDSAENVRDYIYDYNEFAKYVNNIIHQLYNKMSSDFTNLIEKYGGYKDAIEQICTSEETANLRNVLSVIYDTIEIEELDINENNIKKSVISIIEQIKKI